MQGDIHTVGQENNNYIITAYDFFERVELFFPRRSSNFAFIFIVLGEYYRIKQKLQDGVLIIVQLMRDMVIIYLIVL